MILVDFCFLDQFPDPFHETDPDPAGRNEPDPNGSRSALNALDEFILILCKVDQDPYYFGFQGPLQ